MPGTARYAAPLFRKVEVNQHTLVTDSWTVGDNDVVLRDVTMEDISFVVKRLVCFDGITACLQEFPDRPKVAD